MGMTTDQPTEAWPDERLVARLAAGEHWALGPLYSRHADFVFNVAAQMVDRATAEEIVQEVFLAVWRKADTFDPARGAFRAWVHRITQTRVLNELRRRSRRPQAAADPDGLQLEALADPDPDPADVVWLDDRRAAVQAAMADLPPPQQQAVRMAFYEELSHQQVASALDLPLGTAKTRIRSGLQKLRQNLVAVAIAALAATLLGVLADRYTRVRDAVDQDDRALKLTTSSDTEALRLTAVAGVPAEAHANYRHAPGMQIVVVTSSYLPPPPPGQIYRAWAKLNGAWRYLGVLTPDASGSARLISEGADLAAKPDALEVTVEGPGEVRQPTGQVALGWSP